MIKENYITQTIVFTRVVTFCITHTIMDKGGYFYERFC